MQIFVLFGANSKWNKAGAKGDIFLQIGDKSYVTLPMQLLMKF